ncbi:hypothetical protein VTO42DRAFT_348 [Malbranchea cinnamomea]
MCVKHLSPILNPVFCFAVLDAIYIRYFTLVFEWLVKRKAWIHRWLKDSIHVMSWTRLPSAEEECPIRRQWRWIVMSGSAMFDGVSFHSQRRWSCCSQLDGGCEEPFQQTDVLRSIITRVRRIQ